MRPVGQGRPLGPEDLPPELLDFDEPAWARPEDLDDPDDARQYQAADRRWWDARVAWCREHGVNLLDVMKADRRRLFPNGARSVS